MSLSDQLGTVSGKEMLKDVPVLVCTVSARLDDGFGHAVTRNRHQLPSGA